MNRLDLTLEYPVFLPLPIRTNEHKLLRFGLGRQNVNVVYNGVNCDNLWKKYTVCPHHVVR